MASVMAAVAWPLGQYLGARAGERTERGVADRDQRVGRSRVDEQLTGVCQSVEPAEADRHVPQVGSRHRAAAGPGRASEHARRHRLNRGMEAAIGRGRQVVDRDDRPVAQFRRGVLGGGEAGGPHR